MKNHVLFILLLIFTLSVKAQSTKKVLFIGNSYTSAHNLPMMVSQAARSTNDILEYDSNTPGGFRLMNHASNATTLSKITAENWDYVVIQAQSQETALGQAQMETEVYPFAATLSNTIRTSNRCSQPMFYMTWGRKNGEPNLCEFLPWVCTYEGMDDAISTTYAFMSETNEAELSPVGAVWRQIIENNPNIELYESDESHPSIAGSYAAACTFYTMIYKKDPTGISWNSTLSELEANIIKQAAKTIVFDRIDDWNFSQNLIADYTENIYGGEVSFTNASSDFDSVSWDFGDSNSSTENNPIHIYTESGLYDVSLTIIKCDQIDTITKTLEIDIQLGIASLNSEIIAVFPNPTSSTININLDKSYNEIDIKLLDLSGKKLIHTSTLNTSEHFMDVSILSSGVYILKVMADGAVYTHKILKK